jgi:two-component system, LytTR family, response regulator
VTQTLRTLIVDDEPLARKHLRQILSSDTAVEVVGECGNGRDAVVAIRDLAPDLVLLDIQMPELDGFGVIQAIGVDRMPDTIFVTAFDEYAVKAFEVHALDYVLKPVNRERLARAVAHVRQRAGGGQASTPENEQLKALLSLVQSKRDDRISIKVDGRTLLLSPDEIDWIEAVDDYVRIHAGRLAYFTRGTLTALATRLPEGFLRVHRSTLVNTSRVREIRSLPDGDYQLTLADGVKLRTGRSYRPQMADFLASFTAGKR